MFAGAPAADALLDVGGNISLMTLATSLGRGKDSLGKKEEEDPV